MISLRPYQQTLADAIRSQYAAGKRAVLAVAPTGSGKTQVFSYVAVGAAGKNKRVLILAHRRELIIQASRKLTLAGVRHGIIAPWAPFSREPVQIASVQTLARRLADPAFIEPDLIVIDESHHIIAAQYQTILQTFLNAKLLGVTATPERLDGRGLGAEAGGPFDCMVVGPTIRELIAGNFLCPSRVFAPAGNGPELSGVRTLAGEYHAGDLARAVNVPSIVGSAVEHYSRLAPGLPAIAFCANVAHATATAEQFRAAGWRAVMACGATPMLERDYAINGLASGQVQVLCAADLVSEGLDIPVLSVVIMLRPTKSLGLYMQQVGRGMRPAPGKDRLIILDHAGNTTRHGMPDAERDWSLAGKKRGKEKPPASRQCLKCYAVFAPTPICPECGDEYAPKPKPRTIEHVAGTLVEVTEAQARAMREADQVERQRYNYFRAEKLSVLLAGAKTEGELHEIAKARGFKRGWVFHIMTQRRVARGNRVLA